MAVPNLNALRIFDAAARHLNFRLAAEELFLTQGAVAQRIRRLEAELGVALFIREARGLAFTEAGRGYHAPVRRALAMIETATRELQPATTRVTVSATPSFASKWLVPRLSRLTTRHPGIELQIVANEGLSNFRTDGVDVAIRHGKPNDAIGLRVLPLAPLDLCAVCSPAVGALLGSRPDLETVARQPLLQDNHRAWDRVFEGAGLPPPRLSTRFNQTALAMDAAAMGQGVALAPALLAETDVAEGRLVVAWRTMGEPANGFYVVTPDTDSPAPATDAVISWLMDEAQR